MAHFIIFYSSNLIGSLEIVFSFDLFVFIPAMLPSVCTALNKSGKEQKKKEKETKTVFQICWQIIIWWARNGILCCILYHLTNERQQTNEPFANDSPIRDLLLSFCDNVRVTNAHLLLLHFVRLHFGWRNFKQFEKLIRIGSHTTQRHHLANFLNLIIYSMLLVEWRKWINCLKKYAFIGCAPVSRHTIQQ